jgi:deoxyribose-phosphate aldolase
MTQAHDFKRNEASGLDLGWVNQIKVNRNAADRRAASLANRRTVKKEYQAAWLVQAIKCIDLTTLGGDDTPGRVERLCMKAMRPLRTDLMEALGVTDLSTGAVCVYHEMIAPAGRILQGRLPIAAVSTAFPAGLASMGTGDLTTLENVAKASWVCMMAGSDFIKTSTGKEGVNATIPVALTMVRAIREYHEQTGFQVGFKPAGGVSSAKSALQYLALMKEELGREWLEPHLFRIGASSLLTDIERQLEHYVTGNYSANHRHAQP